MASLSRYETLMLAPTEITKDEISMIEQELNKITTQAKGNLSCFDTWGKYQLAYPVRKNSYGVYLLARYEIPSEILFDTLQKVETLLKIKCNEIVLRHVTMKLDPEAPTTYFKPESLTASKESELSPLKEKKITHLLDTVDASEDVESFEPEEEEIEENEE